MARRKEGVLRDPPPAQDIWTADGFWGGSQFSLGVWPLAVAHDPVVGPTLMPRLGTLIGLSRLFKKKKKKI